MEYRCAKCNRGFRRESHLNDHLRSIGHALRTPIHRSDLSSTVHDGCTQFRCCDCNRDFVREQALMQHLRDKIHSKPKHPRGTVPCGLCGKLFITTQAMQMHKASRVHKPLCAPLYCIGSNGCGKKFDSPSSMILHLESGSCPSGLTRQKLNAVIAQQDPKHLITSPTALGSTESRGGNISYVAPLPLFLCPLCPPTHNRFRTARDLDNHSRSPAHALKIFHCPAALSGRSRKKLAEKSFSTLSGLAMHVESGACGKGMFREVLKFVNERFKDIGIREIRLVK
ncbi:hypothetical protein BDZ45DRAFT_647691 [Acephala macrosclerotiorum]|nr:hypothetical protein BDZ45DRAFT_647691 [Acephala macrosclerotiorum]